MARVVFKYDLKITDIQEIALPTNSTLEKPKFLFAGLDPNGAPCIWIEHLDPRNTPPESLRMEKFRVLVIGTGNPMPPLTGYNYLGSFVQRPFVWHVYVEERP